MEFRYKIWFSRIQISNKLKIKLLNLYTEEQMWNFTKIEWEKIFEEKCSKKIENILEISKRENLYNYEKYMFENKIKLRSFKEKEYPKKLKNILDKPAYIFVRGNEEILDEQNVAIVGSRNATEYGKKIARNLAKELSDNSINIVSGLAIGIDKYAHLGSLESSIGKTIAVLGTGVADSDVYPLQNKRVFERILEKNGAIVSEYVLGTKPLKQNFPLRNRIISALSDKIVVVEAKIKSGSLITAYYGLDQGKEIYAVPGSINSEYYKGTNGLIKEGAFLLESANDLFINY